MTPPGETPELFAPGIVSSVFHEHSGAVFSPDGKELYWTRAINEGRSPRIVVILFMEQVDGKWTNPEIAPFNILPYSHINSISPDGDRLYFYSSDSEGNENVWVINMTKDGWGEPRPFHLYHKDSTPIKMNEVHESSIGNLYFDCVIDTVIGDYGIAWSKKENGEFQESHPLGPNINHPSKEKYADFNSTVDPKEEYIVFTSRRPGGYSGQNLYISFRQKNGTWGPARNLGPEINIPGAWISWPQLSPDGKYLFYTSRIKPFSVEDIEQKNFSYYELEQFQNSFINGWANIYWVNTSFVKRLKSE